MCVIGVEGMRRGRGLRRPNQTALIKLSIKVLYRYEGDICATVSARMKPYSFAMKVEIMYVCSMCVVCDTHVSAFHFPRVLLHLVVYSFTQISP